MLTLVLALLLVLLVPIAFVAIMLARASSTLDAQDDADLMRYRELGPDDIVGPPMSAAGSKTGS